MNVTLYCGQATVFGLNPTPAVHAGINRPAIKVSYIYKGIINACVLFIFIYVVRIYLNQSAAPAVVFNVPNQRNGCSPRGPANSTKAPI